MVVASQKPLMVLPRSNMADLHAGPATGMGFYLFESGSGFLKLLMTVRRCSSSRTLSTSRLMIC